MDCPGDRYTADDTLTTMGHPSGTRLGAELDRRVSTLAALALAWSVRAQPTPPADLAAYLALVAQYRDGRYEAATNELAAWPQDAMERAIQSLAKVGGSGRQPEAIPVADLETLVLLHAELGQGLGVQLSVPSRRLHLEAVRRLMQVPFVAADAAFCRRFRLLTGFIDQGRFDFVAAGTAIEGALRSSPDDSYSLMALGRIHETAAAMDIPGLTALGSGGKAEGLEGPARAELASAAELYRHALVSDPSLHEARLRLGRVLQLQARGPEAHQALEDVIERSPDRNLLYMANLLLGALQETDGELFQAVAYYREAMTADPRGLTAKRALAHALHRLGRRAEALDLVSRPLSDEVDAPDAWLLYKMGAFDLNDQIARLWRELRESVRR